MVNRRKLTLIIIPISRKLASVSFVDWLQKMTDQESLSHRAEIFRSKLIDDFQLLETITDDGRERAPVYNSSDVTGIDTPQLALVLSISEIHLHS